MARVSWARAVSWSPTSHWRCPLHVRKTLYTMLLVRTRVHALGALPPATFNLLLQACARASAHARSWEEHAVALYGDSFDRVDLFLQMGKTNDMLTYLIPITSPTYTADSFSRAHAIFHSYLTHT